MYKGLILLRYLSDGRLHSKKELADMLEVSEATIRKYIDIMRDYGIEIKGERGIYGGYKMLNKFCKY